jgi:hypothetical protein
MREKHSKHTPHRRTSQRDLSENEVRSLQENNPFAKDQKLFLRAVEESAQATQIEIHNDWEMKHRSRTAQ